MSLTSRATTRTSDRRTSPRSRRLGELVRFWTSAVENKAIWFAADRGYFEIDWDRVDQLGIPDGVL